MALGIMLEGKLGHLLLIFSVFFVKDVNEADDEGKTQEEANRRWCLEQILNH